MKKALITGSLGFIGKNLKKEIQKDFEIFEINEDIFRNENWINVLSIYLNHLECDVVFHIGACSNTLETNANYMMERNYEFSRIVSDHCKSKNIPLIYSSSAANYGVNNQYPSNLYGWSKYIAEQYIIKNDGIALRYFNVYGEGEEEKQRMASIAYQMFIKYKNGEEIKLFPKKPSRDFVYVKDVLSANIFAYNNYSELKGKYYDVGSGESRTFEDVLKIMEIPFTYVEESNIPKGYQFYTRSNKEKWMPNWNPRYNIELGLKEYLTYLNS